jgi:hypothetical protein
VGSTRPVREIWRAEWAATMVPPRILSGG